MFITLKNENNDTKWDNKVLHKITLLNTDDTTQYYITSNEIEYNLVVAFRKHLAEPKSTRH